MTNFVSRFFYLRALKIILIILPFSFVYSHNLCIGTATTLVNGHEPVSYETLKFCGSFLQIYIVKVKGP